MHRPWNDLPIIDCGESLEELPNSIFCIKPHPYVALGAPYGDGLNPFRLRIGVIDRLEKSQEFLRTEYPNLRLAIFDAWRPVDVQAFMVDYTISEQCQVKGLDIHRCKDSLAIKEVIDNVYRFWAPPSSDPKTPPPHSTGAAIDLTLADDEGNLLDMGGEIDVIGEISEPNYYLDISKTCPESALLHFRRNMLAKVMKKSGFCQHPNEWWHFSYGDQLWAWKSKRDSAFYGTGFPSINSSTD